MKLELKHLAPYLPYGLEVAFNLDQDGYEYGIIDGLNKDLDIVEVNACDPYVSDIKPLLRPLSDLTKEIEHNGEKFVPIEYFEENYYTLDLHQQCNRVIKDPRWMYQCRYMFVDYLFKWHFDVFGLIEQGLAIEKK